MFAMMSSAWDSASEETSVKGNECGVVGSGCRLACRFEAEGLPVGLAKSEN